jgi:transcriptional regulator with XRE-family HTH domain
MTSFLPAVTNRALAILLAGADCKQARLAALAGLKPKTVSAYISGKEKTLSMAKLFWLAGLLDIEPAEVQDALLLAERLTSGAAAGRPALVPELARLTEEVAAARLPRLLEEADLHEARRRARGLWSALRDSPAGDWRLLLTQKPALATWAVCETLAEQSEAAASDDADRALALATLALWVAGQVADDALRPQCTAFARGIFGNARRVRSDLRGADADLALALRLWQEQEATGAPQLLDGTRLLDLQASLRIDQRRLPEARALLAEAATRAAPGLPLGRILVKDARALEFLGDYHSALETLRRAAPLIPETEVRQRWCGKFNEITNLCHLGETAEAERLLPRLRALAAEIHYKLVGVRQRWLEARVDAGAGRRQKAVEALSSVRAHFAEKKIRYDEALVSLELAGLYLEQGRTADVKRLVRLMAPVFEAEGIHAEAKKALALFHQAVELETLTLELVRRLVAYLYRARHNPDLPFAEEA